MSKRLWPDSDIDALVGALNERAERAAAAAASIPPTDRAPRSAPARDRCALPAGSGEARTRIRELLAAGREANASDLLLVAGAAPTLRIVGRLTPLGKQRLTAEESAALCAALLPKERRSQLGAGQAVDFAVSFEGLGRFRCNLHRVQGSWAVAIRLLPDSVPDLSQLLLPEVLARFTELEYGLVLVTGPTGSGKTTTLAALLKRVLATRRVHVITIEDPVEYVHPHGDSVVEHIEVGVDSDSFPRSVLAALRQDPDVLLIGEMRESASMAAAITAAETGRLVFATLHTGDAPQTIHRIVDSYPAGQAGQIRSQLSNSLAAIVSQQLLPRADGTGRVPAVEVLIATPAVRNLIRTGKIEQLRTQFTLEQQVGMLSLDVSLQRLVREGLVDFELARRLARQPTEFSLSRETGRG